MSDVDPFPPLPPPEAWPGCLPLAQAHEQVRAWLDRHTHGTETMAVAEALSAAAWLTPSLGPWVPSLEAWLACLARPAWSARSIAELHRTARGRWPGADQGQGRRRLIGEIEGGLAGPGLSGSDWAVWLPSNNGGVVLYDGNGPARWVSEAEARKCALGR
jgi:hypothetical protein